MLIVKGAAIIRGRKVDEAGNPIGELHKMRRGAGSDPLLICRDWHHEIEAEEDLRYFCIYASRDENGNVVAEWNGNVEAIS